MAKIVRIRKAHVALHRALLASSPSLRSLFEGSYVAAGEAAAEAYELARKSDRVRADIDAAIARDVADASARAAMERAWTRMAAQLDAVAVALEGCTTKVACADADAFATASETAGELAGELELLASATREALASARA